MAGQRGEGIQVHGRDAGKGKGHDGSDGLIHTNFLPRTSGSPSAPGDIQGSRAFVAPTKSKTPPAGTRADLSASRIFRSNGWFLQRGVVAERHAMPARIMSGLEPRHREIVRREMLAWIPTDRIIRRLPAPTSASFALDGTEIARVVPLASRPRPFLLWKLTISRPQPR